MRSTVLSLALLCLAATVARASPNDGQQQVSITDPQPTGGPSSSPPPSSSSDSSSTTSTSDTSTSSTSSSTSAPPSTSSSSTEPTKTQSSHSSITHSSSTSTKSTSDTSAITSGPQSSTISPVTITRTEFVSNSSVVQTFTSSTPVPVSTSGSLSSEGGSSGSSGLSTSAKDTIIGVVVGVGGAIVLAGLAFVAWRVWGPKRHDHDHDEDDLMSAGTAVGSHNREKVPGSANTPFKSTLDQYHNPGPVNAASNF